MANVISFSLFGHGEKQAENCFDFKAYLRYLGLSLRMQALIYPDWKVYLTVDEQTYNSVYKYYFDYHVSGGVLVLNIVPKQELCKMMLRRMQPMFVEGCDRFLCRDLDSLFTYREAQAVQYWINSGRIGMCITDSVSHTIPLMGGMVGFQSKELRDILKIDSFEGLLSYATEIDYSQKGADQTFLNKVLMPRVANSLVEYYILGMPNSFREQCFNYIHDIELTIPKELKENNGLISHIGTAGYAVEPVLKFYDKYFTETQKKYFNKVESEYKDVFYWQN